MEIFPCKLLDFRLSLLEAKVLISLTTLSTNMLSISLLSEKKLFLLCTKFAEIHHFKESLKQNYYKLKNENCEYHVEKTSEFINAIICTNN